MKIPILIKTNWLKDLSGAWLFYTILPKWPFIPCQFNRIVRFAPFIGVFIGAVQSIAWILLSKHNWPIFSLVLISISISIILTGGIHIDGLIDTADGIGAGPTKCFEAMKDSRVGAIGVQAFLVIILLQIASLIKLESTAPLAFPIASFCGRFSQIWAVGNFKYLNISRNYSFHKKHWEGNKKEMIPSLFLFFILVLVYFLSPFSMDISQRIFFMFGVLLSFIPAIIIPTLINWKIGGHNGDTYGASLVLVETTTLIILSAFSN